MSTTTPTTLSGTYMTDSAHGRIGFVARHAMVTKVRASFNEFDGSGSFDAEDPSRSNLQLTIKADSIDTRNADRDAHCGNDFFDMEQFPEITFLSTAVGAVDEASGAGVVSIRTAIPRLGPRPSSSSLLVVC